MNRFTVVLILLLLASPLAAQTRYVSDQLDINVRTGQSTSHKIIRQLSSGTAVQVLETDAGSGYTRIRAGSTEGWVLTRFLMRTPAAREQLAAAQQRVAELELADRQRRAEMGDLAGSRDELEASRAALEESNRKLEQQLSEIRRTASSALALDAENKELKSKLMTMEREKQALSQDNEQLRDRTRRDWFMVGAGVIIVGIIIGLILPRIRFRKRSSWDSL